MINDISYKKNIEKILQVGIIPRVEEIVGEYNKGTISVDSALRYINAAIESYNKFFEDSEKETNLTGTKTDMTFVDDVLAWDDKFNIINCVQPSNKMESIINAKINRESLV